MQCKSKAYLSPAALYLAAAGIRYLGVCRFRYGGVDQPATPGHP